jgi:NarL family two-component system sensor histidine kinase LiaS
MEERVNELGGSLNIASAPGKGTRIEIRVPLMAEGG